MQYYLPQCNGSGPIILLSSTLMPPEESEIYTISTLLEVVVALVLLLLLSGLFQSNWSNYEKKERKIKTYRQVYKSYIIIKYYTIRWTKFMAT